ncbi:hypothetical protein A5624_00535 [Mycobacterium sp. 1482292.6]|nr:hypothetical protein A5624_00535 [Mycobacterium sp. 1482292.6]
MNLEHRVLYRALVDIIAQSLPEHLRERPPIEQFRRAPLGIEDAAYVSKTDITSYYSYVDHDLLADELTAQTGDELAIVALTELLESIMGRRLGLPQVHKASDILGDTYIDRARRRLRRQGYAAFTYSDDFRIASASLGSARSALEACATEARDLGLVLNERKTYTYGRDKYEESLGDFARAEQALFDDTEMTAAEFFLLDDYADEEREPPASESADPPSLGPTPLESSIDDTEATEDDESSALDDKDIAQRGAAAAKAWDIWLWEDESEDVQSGIEATITQSLLARALPALGDAHNDGPLGSLPALLRLEPALTPQISSYLIKYCSHGPKARASVRGAIDGVIDEDILNTWQAMWIAYTLGYVRRLRSAPSERHLDWLNQCVARGPDGVAATAAASLGRLAYGETDLMAAAMDRVGPEWRHLVFWGLARIDPVKAAGLADSQLDRTLLRASQQKQR